MMDMNLSQAANVILVESNGQSYIIQNDTNILNSVPCTEPNIIGNNLQSIQPDYSFNLNCDNDDVPQKDNNLSTNHQIVAILDENQSQTFEITSEQAAELGLHFDRNDSSKKKLILSSDSLNSISLTNHEEESQNTLFNTNFNLSIVNASPVVSSSSSDTQFLESQFVHAAKKFTLEPIMTVENTSLQSSSSTKYPFLMQLDDKTDTPSPCESQLSENITDSQSVQSDLLSPQSSVYDSIFLKEPVYDDICGISSLPDTVKGVKKKKTVSKKHRAMGTSDLRKNLKSLNRAPSTEKDMEADNTEEISIISSPICNSLKNMDGSSTPHSKLPDLSSSTPQSPLAHKTSSMTNDSPENLESTVKDAKKSKCGSSNSKKQSKQECDERLDVTVNAQSLTKEQLKQIAQVFSKKHIMLDTKAPSKNVLYDPETNTRIICRVVYPEDLCKKKSGDSFATDAEKKDSEMHKNSSKKKGRRSKLKEDEKTSLTNKSETKSASNTENKKSDDTDQNVDKVPVLVSRTTRSGRVSRPPRHMGGNKTSFQDDAAPTPFQSVSALPKPEQKAFEFLPGIAKKRNVSAEFKCPTCDKVYLGQTKMAMHFEKNPTHRNMEKWNQILQSLKKTDDSQKKPGEVASKPKYGSGNKKGKKRQTYEQCKIILKKALEDCSKADVAVLAGPIVASVLSVWEFLVLRSAKMKLDNENHVLALLRELKLLLNHIKSSADSLLSPINCSALDPQVETTNQIEIRDDTTSHVLGLPCGKYCVNSNYENSWLKSFSEQNKKLMENDCRNLKRLRHETAELNPWPSSDDTAQFPAPAHAMESFNKGENDLNASNLLLSENNTHSSASYIDEIMSQRLENLRTQQQNELNDCFSSVDDLINNLSVNISSMAKTSVKIEGNIISNYANVMDKCDTSLDLNFVNFQRNSDIISEFNVISSLNDEQSSINRNLNFVESSSVSDGGPCATSLVNYVDDSSLYDNISSNLQFNNSDAISNVSSSTEDLMKSLVSFELRPSDSSLNFDPINQFEPVVMHNENVPGSSRPQLHSAEFRVDNGGFDRTDEHISNLVTSRNPKLNLKEEVADDLDFVHSLDCLNPSI